MVLRSVTIGSALVATLAAAPAAAQTSDEPTRTALIDAEKAEKAKDLHPYVPGRAEQALNRAETALTTQKGLHPFFENAYSGGGFTLGAGYLEYIGAYNTIDVRGSLTFKGYKRIEAEYLAPRLLARQATLSIIGGWREATQVGYYGLGNNTTADARANYAFQQPYLSTTFTVRPADRIVVLRAGFETSQWIQDPGSGDVPSVEQIYTPATLPGLGTSVIYLHSQGTVGIDSRASPGYSRRGGFYGVSFHDFTDPHHRYGFTQVDYEALQHVPILRETWVLSFRGLLSTTQTKSDEVIPFYMLPAIGGGSSLRGYSSWRFRDRNSLKLQAEWRVMVNRFLDMAVFYDAGKVAADTGDLNLSDLRSDFGLGFRFHGPLSTPLRIDVAHSDEGFRIVWAASAVF
jgi:opacity protein-like surface antigen